MAAEELADQRTAECGALGGSRKSVPVGKRTVLKVQEKSPLGGPV